MSDMRLRRASPADRVALAELQRNSMEGVGSAYYTRRQLDAFFAERGFDIGQVLDSTELWVIEGEAGLLACGGWRPEEDGAALIRSVFVHSAWTRRGLAGRLLDHVEAAAAGCGAHMARLVSTLSGQAFYAARGYAAVRPHVYDLAGVRFRGMQMEKPLSAAGLRRSAA